MGLEMGLELEVKGEGLGEGMKRGREAALFTISVQEIPMSFAYTFLEYT